MVRRRARLLALAGALVIGACWSHNVADTEDARFAPAYIIFKNESLAQADVFAVIPGGQSRKLGTVFSGVTDTLTVPADIVAQTNLSLVARLLAGRSVSSGNIALRPGDALRVTLPIDQRLLSVLPDS